MIEIAGIKTYIHNEHNESYGVWHKEEIRGATLLHVDAHPDTAEGMRTMQEVGWKNPFDYYRSLSIGNFLCAAVHHRIIALPLRQMIMWTLFKIAFYRS